MQLPDFSAGITGDWPDAVTADSLRFPTAELAPIIKQLHELGPERASAQIVAWLDADDESRALILVHLALTDATWAAARARVDGIKRIGYLYLPYSMAQLGLEVLPRLIEAYEDRSITKQARWVYRFSIVLVLAAAASRGETWKTEHDRFLAIDPAWWFARSQFINGNYHNDLMLSGAIAPFLRIAVAGLPKPRAHAIIDAALDVTEPAKFPMCFFALPVVTTHWRADYLDRAIRATRLGETAKKRGFVDSPIWERFRDDMCELGLFEKVVIERYKTGHSLHHFELAGIEDPDKLYAQAKRLLPAAQFARFDKHFQTMYQ